MAIPTELALTQELPRKNTNSAVTPICGTQTTKHRGQDEEATLVPRAKCGDGIRI